MAYNPNIPLNTDSIKVSAGNIQENYSQINTVFGRNHGPFNTAFAGMHNFIQMPVQVDPPTTADNEGALFTQLGEFSGLIELMFRRQSDGNVVNITQSLGNTIATDPGFFFIGNVLIKWGTILDVGMNAGNYNLPFPVGAIPPFNTPPIVFTQQTGTLVVQIYTLLQNTTALQFSITKLATAATINVPFFA